eukprot:m.486606 g.486606  ORF g.486606 m.486606 type:complete len:766 (+) comp24518_c0_seq1:130-2427(+)
MQPSVGLFVALAACLVTAVVAAPGQRHQEVADDPVQTPGLFARAYEPLPVGSVTPKGWLLEQLKLQADGLSGHLSQFWADVMDSVWIGGTADGGLHERAPYWLNGIVPLAALLRNAGEDHRGAFQGVFKVKQQPHDGPVCTNGTDMRDHDISNFDVPTAEDCRQKCNETDGCVGFVVDACFPNHVHCWLKNAIATTESAACRCFGVVAPHPPAPVNITEQSNKYVDYIVSKQDASGWLGPDDAPKNGNTYWGRSNVILSLEQYAEANPASAKNISAVVLKYMLELKRRITSSEYAPLQGWAAQRWQDIALGTEWLLAHAPQGHDQDLSELLQLLHTQGVDWEGWFETFTGNAGPHNVNNAQGLKSAAVWYVASGNKTLPALSRSRMANLDAKYGLPTGMFNGDELLPNPATRNPSRGIELCGVVEAMFSYTTMFSVHGDLAFADRAERIAFNALPATWASPKGGDMWAHQYLQAINEINAMKVNPHVWTHDGPSAETYGLEPNYGCCTANFNQGWPKFASMAVFSTSDGGAAVGLLIPLTATLPDGSIVDIDTSYPFEDQVHITVIAKRAMPLHLRIPSWASGAQVNGSAVPNGTMQTFQCKPGTNWFPLTFTPEITLKTWGDFGTAASQAPVSVHRGALMYSLPLGLNFTTTAHHFGLPDQSNDYEVVATTPWSFALDKGPLKFVSTGYQASAAPFNHTNWPVHITAQVRPLSGWDEKLNSAAEPPASPACKQGNGQCGEPQVVQLVPHGGTDLRMGELPLSGF